jgi:hypothetical protein
MLHVFRRKASITHLPIVNVVTIEAVVTDSMNWLSFD